MKKEGQNWSFDAIAAVGIFLVAIIIFLWLSGYLAGSTKTKDLGKEGERILNSIDGSKNTSAVPLIIADKISEIGLNRTANMSYASLKQIFGVKADFCLHLEDESGNLINISGAKVGIGSPKAKIGGIACG